LSAKLSEALRGRFGVRELCLRAFTQDLPHRRGQGCPKRLGLERTDVRILESGERLRGQVVVAAGLDRRCTLAQAGKRKRVVADRTDIMLGLP
jgi:hypothetical protein